jgi:hypothetical protein
MEDVLVRILNKGQMRILEAVIATMILLVAFTSFYFMLYSSEKFFEQEAVDLNKLGYNALRHLVESGVVEQVVGDAAVGKAVVVKALQGLLPPNVYFDLTITNITPPSSGVEVLSASNAVPRVFDESGEVASATMVYTSSRGEVYKLVLRLAIMGA